MTKENAGQGAGEAKGNGIQVVELARISLDHGLQVRCRVDEQAIAEYAEAMKAEATFPPVDLFAVGGELLLADGRHRVEAAKLLEKQSIAAVIHQGSKTDALRFALQANLRHGLRLTRADRRKAVEMALAAWPGWSDHAIAVECGVVPTTVGTVRRQMANLANSGKRVGLDGKIRELPAKPAKVGAKRDSLVDRSPCARDESKPPKVLGLRERWGESASLLAELNSLIKDFQSIDPGDEFFQPTDLRATLGHLERAWHQVARSFPRHYCPACEGQGTETCKLCRGRGLVGAEDYERFVSSKAQAKTSSTKSVQNGQL